MLQFKKVNKKFGSLTAVKDLSFHIKKGEIVGLIGQNGSGKTTTIKMIAGLYTPTKGQILVKEHDVAIDSEFTRAVIGYIPDEPAVYGKLTGDEFLNFIGEAFQIPKEERQAKINELHQIFPMGEQANGYFEDYSRGTRQKYMIMAALLHHSPLLLIDEPIVGLDPGSAETAINLFSDYVKDNEHSVLICTHTLSVAEKICHRFLVMHEGILIADNTLKELRQKTGVNGSLEEIYLKLTTS